MLCIYCGMPFNATCPVQLNGPAIGDTASITNGSIIDDTGGTDHSPF